MRFPALLSILLTVAGASTADTQTRDARTRTAGREAVMGRGWTALAGGRADQADAAAKQILDRAPWDHGALLLRMSARSAGSALAGLDIYEAWLAERRSEDVYLLEPVARATLAEIASGTDRGLWTSALEQLARHGDAGAGKQLAEAGGSAIAADAALARLGDAEAIRRLQAMAASEKRASTPDLADALADAGPSSVPALLSMLEGGRGPERAAAAMALGRLRATDAADALRRASKDPEPHLSMSATVALARLGDADASARAEELLAHPVPDVRLLAAHAWEGRPGPWVEAVRPLLDDTTGLVRLEAARLLAAVEPQAAAASLAAALQDQNPVVRGEAARTSAALALDGLLALDLPALRRLLRDGEPANRLTAASALLAHVRGRR